MAAQSAEAYNSDIGILRELYHLNRCLDDAQASRRALFVGESARLDGRSRSSRHLFLSLSPWCLHKRFRQGPEGDDDNDGGHHAPVQRRHQLENEPGGRRKGLWRWKPMRALAHIGMHRLTCFFSVKVVMIRHLAPWANGLRLSVTVRKKEATEAAAQTMPSRVMQGSAEFGETLIVRCHLYCGGGGAGTWKPLRFEPRPFLITAVAVDAPILDLGKNVVDLSLLVQESINLENLEGQRIRQWDMALQLSGKAERGELVLKIRRLEITDGGIGICGFREELKPEEMTDPVSFISKKLSKSSFSITSPRIMADEASSAHSKWTNCHSRNTERSDKLDVNLPVLNPCVSTATLNLQFEDFDLPEYEVVDKGIEIEDERGVMSQKKTQGESISREDVKELELISQNVTAPELMVNESGDFDLLPKSTQEHEVQNLDTEEETVTRQFLQMLELEKSQESEHDTMDFVTRLNLVEECDNSDAEDEHYLLPDLGKSLGSVVQTRDGGYLASLNPFNARVAKKEPPKVAMQISRELILDDMESGHDLFRRLAALGPEELSAKLFSLTSMDELVGKTAEQIAFEGIASAITSGRSKEGASSSAAKSIAAVKKMAAAMSKGRKDRILTGIWSEDEEALSADEMVTFSLQKMEAMVVGALKVQAEITDEGDEVPFVVEKDDLSNDNNPLDKAISVQNWSKSCRRNRKIAVLVVIQMRDPSRRYEAVGGPMIAVAEGVGLDENRLKEEEEEEEEDKRRFRLMSVHVGGLKLRSETNMSAWDGEVQRLCARQWLVENGMEEASRFRRRRGMEGREGYNLMWTFSSRLTSAGVWLNPVRNANMKL